MVAATSRAQANGKTPIHSFFNMYFSGLEAFGQAYDPFTKGMARAQLEFMGHLNRRAQAYLEIPNRLGQCRTPQDLVNEQVRFWRGVRRLFGKPRARDGGAVLVCAAAPCVG